MTDFIEEEDTILGVNVDAMDSIHDLPIDVNDYAMTDHGSHAVLSGPDGFSVRFDGCDRDYFLQDHVELMEEDRLSNAEAAAWMWHLRNIGSEATKN